MKNSRLSYSGARLAAHFCLGVLCAGLLFGLTSCALPEARRARVSDNDWATDGFRELQELCTRQPILGFSDMGVRNGYGPSIELQKAVDEITAHPDATAGITQRYCDSVTTDWSSVPVETIFPLLDVLLKAERATGLETASARERLWNVWREKFPVMMGIFYRSPLPYYEADIQRSWNLSRNEK